MGYAGGEKENPTYYQLGNHTEVISIDYDTEILSYEDMLDLFWKSHRCDQVNSSRQYMNAIFYHDEAQKKAAEASRKKAAEAQDIPLERVETGLLPVGDFTYAEGYHQKYYLGQNSTVRAFLEETYPDGKSLADSAVATRLNAYLGTGMKKDWAKFLKELSEYGLPEEMEKAIRERVESF